MTVRLGDVVEMNPRKGLSDLNDETIVGFVPMSAVCEERKEITEPEIRTLGAVRKGYTPMQNGDIIIAKITPCFENGKLTQVNLDHDISFGSTEFHVFRPTGQVAPRLIYHLLRSERIQAEGRSHMKGAAGQKRVPSDFFRVFEFRVPRSILAQQRVARILDAADALRAKRRESLAQLDALLQSTFLHLFGDPVTNPVGWEKHQLESFCRPKQWPTIMKKDLTEDGYPVYGANGTIGFYSDFNHADPTVLITCRGATCGTINVCSAKSYVTGNAMALDNADPNRVELKFLEHVLKATDFGSVITGVAQPQITRSSLKLLTVPLPPLSLQHRFARIVESVERQRARLRGHLTELDALFASLQHRVFRGEL